MESTEKFVVYTIPNCKHCVAAKQLLQSQGMEYDELSIPTDVTKEALQARVTETGSQAVIRSAPQIFHGPNYIGGAKQLVEYLTS